MTIIQDFSLQRYRLPLHVPFKVAYGTSHAAEPMIATFSAGPGMQGIGEGAPPSYFSQKDKDDGYAWAFEVGMACKGKTVTAACSYIAALPAPDPYGPMVKACLEMALLRLQAGRSASLFGTRVRSRQSFKTDLTIPLIPVAEIASFLNLFQTHQFDTIKIKVSGDMDADLERCRVIEGLLPPEVSIFLDGNQGFSKTGALHLCGELAKASVRKPLFFEQPLAKDDWQGHYELSRKLPFPVCLDESITEYEDVQRMVREQTASMLNLKFMKSGVQETLRIYDVAARAGVTMMIGGMVETEVTMLASLDLLCHAPAIRFADLDTPFFLKSPFIDQSPWAKGTSQLTFEGPLLTLDEQARSFVS